MALFNHGLFIDETLVFNDRVRADDSVVTDEDVSANPTWGV